MIVLTWIESPADPTLRRTYYVQPGYDCGVGGSTCKHKPKGDHGRAANRRHYVVGDGRHAISLVVTFDNGTRPPGSYYPHFHGPYATDKEGIRMGSQGEECGYIEAKRCFDPVLANPAPMADPAPVVEQPEAFWLGLEECFRGYRTRYLADVAAAPHRCESCNGTGLKPKEP